MPLLDNLVVRVKNGLKSSKYKPVDYEELYAITEAKKLQSANILLKVSIYSINLDGCYIQF